MSANAMTSLKVCLVLFGYIALTQAALSSVVNHCCGLGVNFATQTDGDCRNLPLDDFSLDYGDDDRMSCITVIEVCCYATRNNKSCEAGKAHAREHGGCDALDSVGAGAVVEKECCGCCKLGQVASQEGLSCQASVLGAQFSNMCANSFSDCCSPLATNGSSSGDQTDGQGNGNGNGDGQGQGHGGDNGDGDLSLCARFTNQLCEQICLDITDENGQPSFRCECEDGYQLVDNLRNCIPANSTSGACSTQNPCDHICTDTGLQIQCSCRPGFTLDTDGKQCNDIDECARQGACSSRQLCVNTVGSFRCEDGGSVGSCAAGMSYNTRTRQCEDVDECAQQSSLCDAGKRCVNTVGSYRCEVDSSVRSCTTGLRYNTLTRRCDDIDECAQQSSLCDAGKRCINTVGSYRCEDDGSVRSCTTGLRYNALIRRCEDIDECTQQSLCEAGKRCVNTVGSYRCEDDGSIRSCASGLRYSTRTRRCEDVDECAQQSSLCEAGKRCVNTVGSFRCEDDGSVGSCAAGLRYNAQRRRCEDIDECAQQSNLCEAGKRCVNTDGSFRCEGLNTCADGFRFNPRTNRCQDINECTTGTAVCSFTQTCFNTVGSYRCEDGTPSSGSCGEGLVMNTEQRRCEDINECTSGKHNCNRANMDCLNTVGSFLCRCFRGYTFEVETQDCQDINECYLGQDSCTEGQQCVNTVGSYYCRRTVSCGTGYTLDEQSQGCVDVDECRLGTNNCGDTYECENIPGSFRCKIKERDCPAGSRLNYRTGICERVQCPTGFVANEEYNCVDIDECQDDNPCFANQECYNTQGSYRCTNRLSCYDGFQPNAAGSFCEDIDECATGTHDCDTTGSPPQKCVNEPGRYQCKCPQGFRFNTANKQCEDEDECSRFGGRVCSVHARCENTPGSYRCVCNDGFESTNNGLTCVDKDECQTPRLCQHTCLNTYGSFECRCDAGYTIAEDKRSCRDINECELNLLPQSAPVCIGLCQNTPGSFQCSCPAGYQMGASGRQCQDIDECATGEARCFGNSQVCVNTRGGYRCNDIQCPPQFFMPPNGRQRGSIRCQRLSYFCRDDDEDCKTAPLSYTYNFLTFPSRVNIPADLFTMRSRSSQRFEFELKLISATGSATRTDFTLINVNANTAMVRLIKKLDGPQEVELQLDMNIYHGNTSQFIGKAIAKIFIYVTRDPWEQLTGTA